MSHTPHDNSLGRQLTTFVVIGVFTAAIDLGTTLGLQELGVQRELSKVFGWCLGTAAAYLLNSRFTFRAKVSATKATQVFILYLSTLGIQVFLYWATNMPLQMLGFSGMPKDVIAFVIAQGVATVTNFALQRVLIFRATPARVVVEEDPQGKA